MGNPWIDFDLVFHFIRFEMFLAGDANLVREKLVVFYYVESALPVIIGAPSQAKG